ncbi:MAG TPA: oxalate/formate MFS antiporter [Pseudorhodoplanes sp.]|nr:oxalate/formate MFS antiporter [Pseudorhodoplanes sp.]
MTIAASASARGTASEATRWGQLIFGIICMVMIANLQYGWTLFVNPIDQKYHWGRAAIQVAFTIFVLTETWLVPVEGYLIDRFGPRVMISGSGVLVAIAWMLNAYADSLFLLYLAAAIGGIGAGVIYGGSVGNALKWFPDRRGLAAGLTAAGFGAGSALTVIPIANMIQASGYESAFWWFGIGQGAVVVVVGLLLRAPDSREMVASTAVAQSRRDYDWKEVLKTPIFWVMYAMFVMVGTGGLMATAQLAPIAKDFRVDNVPVSLLGLTLPALTFALSIDRVLNGVCRPFFGWVSDNIGRENTMFLAFLAEGIGIYLLLQFATHPVMFVILSGLVFFAWGEIYSLFPAMCTDVYGRKFATTNYGMLYTAKGTAALLVPLGNVVMQASGSWNLVFLIAAALNLVAAAMALLVLKPMRSRMLR